MYTLLVVLVVGGLYILRDRELRGQISALVFNAEQDFSSFVTKKVEKEAFKVTVEAKGTVDSSRNSSLVNTVEGQTTIISIVPPGTLVQEPLRAKFAPGDGVKAIVKEIRNLSSRTPTVVIEERTPKRNEQGILIDEQGNPVVDEEGNPVTDYDKAAYDVRILEHPYEMSVYSEVLVEVDDEVEYDEILIGDLVCELDASTLIDAEKQQQISATQAKADLEKGVKNVEIQIAQNESDIAAAKLAMKLADLDLKKYQQGDYIKEKEGFEGQIQQAQEDLKLAQESLEFTRRVARKGYKTPDDIEVERIKVLKAQLALNVAEKELEVLENFTKQRTIAELLEMAEESQRELERVKLAGEAALAQFEAELESRKLSYNVQTSQLERVRAQIEACRMVAPQAGQVVYANESSRRGSEPVVIEEGTTVRERQKIINLPDMTAMKVDARIHESKISNVVPNLDVVIRVDAIPAHVYSGVLETVSSVPLPGSWPNTDLKEYEAIVKILDQGKWLNELKPGMSANIEIVVEETYEKLLQIPVQAAVDVGRGYYAWVMTENGPERRKLKLGRSNDVKFVVEEGLQEGDEVILNPRTHFVEEIAKLETESLQKAQKERREGGGVARADGSAERSDSAASPGERPGPPSGPNDANAQSAPNGRKGFDPAEIFARRDADGDGELSGDEISDRMKENLARMDTDGNGKLSKSEFIEAMSALRQAGGGRPPGQGPGQGPGRRNGGGDTRGAEE